MTKKNVNVMDKSIDTLTSEEAKVVYVELGNQIKELQAKRKAVTVRFKQANQDKKVAVLQAKIAALTAKVEAVQDAEAKNAAVATA